MESMCEDVLAAEGVVMLGSRLKRLSERLQAGAESIARDCGLSLMPGQAPLITALWRLGPLGIGEAAERTGFSQPAVTRAAQQLEASGLIANVQDDKDRRQRRLALTPAGEELMDIASKTLWPRLREAIEQMCETEILLQQIASLEDGLSRRPLQLRQSPVFVVRPFSDDLARTFAEINRAWIEGMYSLEPVDEAQLADPRAEIIETGGDILFAQDPELGIVGTCGLLKTGQGEFELIKMAVKDEARGRGAGEFLLRAAIERAYQLGAEKLFLLTNRKSAAAIKLYERNGFVHDEALLKSKGGEYARCDVAMRHIGESSGS